MCSSKKKKKKESPFLGAFSVLRVQKVFVQWTCQWMDEVDFIWKICIPLANLLSGNYGSDNIDLRMTEAKDLLTIPVLWPNIHRYQVHGLRHGWLQNFPIFLKSLSLLKSITSVTKGVCIVFLFFGELFLLAMISTSGHWLWRIAWLYSLASKAYLYPDS